MSKASADPDHSMLLRRIQAEPNLVRNPVDGTLR